MENTITFIPYCRKSSEEDTKQIQSLETQERILLDYAQKYNIQITEIVKESRSAKTDGNRPLFTELLKSIREDKAQGILVVHIDRLARNGIEAGQIIKLFEEGKLKEIRTPTKVYNSVQDMLYMDFDFVFASHYSRQLSVKVKEGLDTKFLKGEYSGPAPLGYMNKDRKIYPDPIRASLMKQAFELYATGEYSLKELSNLLYDKGLRTRTTGNKVYKTVIHRQLTDPTYYGVVRRKGEIRAGIHKPLINKVLFDRIQDVLNGKYVHKKKKHHFLYRDYLFCAECGCKLTATIKKGKYTCYYCTNGKGICTQRINYLKEEEVYKLMFPIFADITLDKDMAELSFDMYADSLKNKQTSQVDTQKLLQDQLDKVNEKLEKIYDHWLANKIDETQYDKRRSSLLEEKINLELQLRDKKISDTDTTLELVAKVKDIATELSTVFQEGDVQVKRDLLKSVLWNSKIKNKEVLSVKYKLPFTLLQNLNKTQDFEIWRREGDSNPR